MHACSCSCALLLLLLLLLPRVPPPPPPPALPTITSTTTPTTTWKMERYMSSSVSGGGRSSGCDAGWMMPAGVLGKWLGLARWRMYVGVCTRSSRVDDAHGHVDASSVLRRACVRVRVRARVRRAYLRHRSCRGRGCRTPARSGWAARCRQARVCRRQT